MVKAGAKGSFRWEIFKLQVSQEYISTRTVRLEILRNVSTCTIIQIFVDFLQTFPSVSFGKLGFFFFSISFERLCCFWRMVKGCFSL